MISSDVRVDTNDLDTNDVHSEIGRLKRPISRFPGNCE